MKQLRTVILLLVLVSGVASSVASGTLASFFDTEVSTDNEMHAGTRCIVIDGGPVTLEHAMPSNWYSEEYAIINTGTLPSVATVHIMNLLCEEAGTVNGEVYYGANSYGPGSPVGAGVASSESELVSEEGGQVGQITITGLGVDCGADNGPANMVISKYVDAKIWFDKDGDGLFEEADSELIVSDTLFNIACNVIELGVIPALLGSEGKGGGWGSYFEYTIGSGTLELPLMVAQSLYFGTVSVWSDATHLYVEYDTSASGWEMAVTHVYVGTEPPPKMAPGQFPYAHEPVTPPLTYDLHVIPLDPEWTGLVYIAAHTEGTDGETGWGKGEYRKFKIELHLQQIEAPGWPDPQTKYWPTNALQGDTCTFDMEFNGDKP